MDWDLEQLKYLLAMLTFCVTTALEHAAGRTHCRSKVFFSIVVVYTSGFDVA